MQRLQARPTVRLIGLAIALVLAGCSGSAGTPVAATGTPVAVTGTQVCTTTADGTQAEVGDITQFRGVEVSCQTETSDPRLTGVQTSAMSIDERADQSADIWGTLTIANDQGTWEGDFSGTVAAGYTTHEIDALATGTGAYVGLAADLHVTSEDGTTFQLTGTIGPAE